MRSTRPLFSIVLLIAGIGAAHAQAPERFSYQAIIRNGVGAIQANAAITLGLEMHQTTANGATVFEETHSVTTSAFGLVNVSVGGGTVVSGDMATVDWSAGPYFIEVKVNGTSMGTTQLLSVPYALHAGSASGAWAINGNPVAYGEFMGTTNSSPLIFKTDNLLAGWANSGSAMTAFGHGALGASGAVPNTAFGKYALGSNINGSANTAVGVSALFDNVAGQENTAVGNLALWNNTASYNTGVGSSALRDNTGGEYNTALGTNAMWVNTFGEQNVGIGSGALESNTTGSRNTAVGMAASWPNITGNDNSSLGYNAGAQSAFPNVSNATALGHTAVTNVSNQVRLGNALITSIGGYASWTNLSDARFKRDLKPQTHGLDFILKLEPITYRYDVRKLNAHLFAEGDTLYDDPIMQEAIAAKERIAYSGFSAQQVEEAAKSVGYDFSGVYVPQNEKDHYALAYAEFVVPLVKAVQEQQAIIDELRARVASLEGR